MNRVLQNKRGKKQYTVAFDSEVGSQGSASDFFGQFNDTDNVNKENCEERNRCVLF